MIVATVHTLSKWQAPMYLTVREVGRRLVVLASDQAGGNDRTWARGDASDDCRAPAGV